MSGSRRRPPPAPARTPRPLGVDLAIGAVVAVLVAGAALLVIDRSGDGTSGPSTTTTPAQTTVPSSTTRQPTTRPPVQLDPAITYTATIETTRGDIVIELDVANAPVASGQFYKLATDGFYEGVTFGRLEDNFMIQIGDLGGTVYGAPVIGEIPDAGYPVGSVAAALIEGSTPGMFDAQFFIVTGDIAEQLQPEYARFATVVEGMDVARAIEDAGDPKTGVPARFDQIVKISITES